VVSREPPRATHIAGSVAFEHRQVRRSVRSSRARGPLTIGQPCATRRRRSAAPRSAVRSREVVRLRVDAVDGGVRPFAEELHPGALDAGVMLRRLDKISEGNDGLVEARMKVRSMQFAALVECAVRL